MTQKDLKLLDGKKPERHRLAAISFGTIASRKQSGSIDSLQLEKERLLLEELLHHHLDNRCVVTRRAHRLYVDVSGHFSERQRDQFAQGVARIQEWEAA
jgi:hypothetical protein